MTQQELYSKFWQFYYQKCNKDYDRAVEQIHRLHLTQLEILSVTDGLVYIKLRRPGLLMGIKGRNLIELEKFLGFHLYIVEDVSVSVTDLIIPSATYGE